MPAELKYIPVAKIKVQNRTRTDFGDMDGLVESIKDKGLLQPITVDANLRLMAGGRRLEAAKKAGLKEIPALIRVVDKKFSELDHLEVELIENIFRQDFNHIERAQHTKKLHDYCQANNVDWSARKLAKLLGRNHMAVARDLQIANALEVVPELAKTKDQSEALKTIKRLEEHAVTGELRRRQEESIKHETDTGKFLKTANANYKIGSCFDGMAELPNNGMIHFIELDPPYAIDLNNIKKGDAPTKKTYNEVPVKEYKAWMEKMASETFRVAGRHCWMICWFGPTHFQLVKDALIKGGWSVNDVPAVWTKGTGQTLAPEYNLANCYEPFFVCRKGQPTLVEHGRGNVFNWFPEPGAKKYHPTQRPISLMMDLFDTFCLPRQIALVPCLGSGVSLRAAYLRGMSGFGWDLSGEYKDKFLLACEQDLKDLNRGE